MWLSAVAACHPPEPEAIRKDPSVPSIASARPTSAPAPVTEAPSASVASSPARPAPAPAPAPATVDRIEVAGDLPASIVRGADGGPPRVVFMAGVCSNAYYYLLAFPEAARAHGGIVAIDGDQPCGAPGSGYRSYSWDPVKQDKRLQAALAAAGVADPAAGAYTLVGYSAGAGIGELMAQRWPDRYARVVLIGAPSDPSPPRLAKERGVVTMSCSRDVPGRMRDAARHLRAAGVAATYLEMPGCTHGNMADGEHVFGEAFGWLASNAAGAGCRRGVTPGRAAARPCQSR